MKFNIGIFIDYKALDISKILRHKYEDYEYEYDDYVFSRSDIGWEAWKRARHEAEGLYLNHEEYIFDKKMNDLYDKDDVCSNITYVELVSLIDKVLFDYEYKSNMCGTALSFCRNNTDETKKYEILSTIIVSECNKGTYFVITRAECSKYFN